MTKVEFVVDHLSVSYSLYLQSRLSNFLLHAFTDKNIQQALWGF